MRSILLCPLFLCLAVCSNAQKQGNIWIFGRNARLDFNSTPPKASQHVPSTAMLSVLAGASSISDSAGRLICYINGRDAYGRFGIMKNGRDIGEDNGLGQHLIIPLPGSDSIFYVFTSRFEETLLTPSPASYHYSIINACLDARTPDSVNGDVIAGKKRVLLYEQSTTKLCAAGDDFGYWIVGHRRYSDSFIAWRLSSSGLAAPVYTRIGPKVGFRNGAIRRGERGQMKFSAAGNKIAMVTDYTRSDTGTLDLFDFNRTTGELSNHCQVPISDTGNTLGVEFSPDGSKVFVTHTESPTAYVLSFRVDNNCALVRSSRDTIFRQGVRGSIASLQAGPDGLIYVRPETGAAGASRLHRILNPNGVPQYDSVGITFGTLDEAGGLLPSYVAGYRYRNRVPPCYRYNTTGVSASASGSTPIELLPNPADAEVRIRATGLNAANHSLIVTDATGRILMRTATLPGRIDVSGFPAGVYFWRATEQQGRVAGGKFVVTH